jgi:hypothetical protein
MSTRKVLVPLLALALAVPAAACRKPAKVLLTKDQQARIQENVLKERPTPRFVSGAIFGDNIKLLGVDVSPTDGVRAGGEVTLTYYWECLRETPGDWKAFGHLELPAGKRMILDHVPVGELYPVSQWKPGEVIRDVQKVTVDPDTKSGPALLWAGLFSEEIYRERGGGDRMKIVNKDKVSTDGDDRARLAQFRVEAKDGPRAPAVVKAAAAKGLPVLDGDAGDEAWKRASELVLGDASGKPADPKAATKVRALWDASALYLSFVVADDAVWSPYKDRDEELWNGDVVEVYLDPNADGKDYVELQISPNNVVFDAKFDTRRQPAWQTAKSFTLEGLKSATGSQAATDDAPATWTVELSIPWASIPGWTKIPPSPGDEMRVNLFRIDAADEKVKGAQALSPAGGDFHDLEKAGTLKLMSDPDLPPTAGPGGGAPLHIEMDAAKRAAGIEARPSVNPSTAKALQQTVKGNAPRP